MNNLSVIPFYQTKEEQDFRLWYAYGELYPNAMPSDYLVPFAFPITYNPSWTLTNIRAFRICGSDGYPIVGLGSFSESFSLSFHLFNEDEDPSDPTSTFAKLVDNGLALEHDTESQTSIVRYLAEPNSDLLLPRGFYYIELILTDGNDVEHTFYSDVMYLEERDNERNYVAVEWWNEENMEFKGGFIPYATEGFRNRLWLRTDVGMPEYAFTEEGEERSGHFFPIRQISEKKYKMSFFAPEYLCDAMRTIRMADHIVITDKLGRVYDVEQFEMDVNWLEQGHYADIECTFQTDTIIKKIGKAY